MATLLAIDLGLKAGFATYSDSGELLRYRSTNFGSPGRLKSAAWTIFRDEGPPAALVVEGDRNLARIWSKIAEKFDAQFLQVSPETWREELLLPRQRRSGMEAKESADFLARKVIEKSTQVSNPTSLRHDAAEAILIGLWGLLHLNWISEDYL